MQNEIAKISPNQKSSQSSPTILIADDDESIRTVLAQALSRAGYQTRSTSNATTLWKWVKEQDGDLVLTDVMMPDGSVFEILPRIRQERPKLPIIVMSAQNTLLTAISAVEQGAYEYLPKPFDLQLLIEVVRRALEPIAEHKAIVQKRRALNDESLPMIGRSVAMQEVYRVLSRVAPLSLSVVIEGEVGVGKALIAKTIHEYSNFKMGNHLNFNCAGMDENDFANLVLSIKPNGQGNTYYFSNIEDASIKLQGRIVAFMADLDPAQGRIIASTSESLRALVSSSKIREDLFYRLSGVTIAVPPLRNRTSDISDLARLFLARANSASQSEKIIDKSAIAELEKHTWPGNVRELENLINSIVALNSQSVIDKQIIEAAVDTANSMEIIVSISSPNIDLDNKSHLINEIFEKSRDADNEYKNIYDTALRIVEKPLFEAVLKQTRGNQIRAAELLGLNRNTLRKKLNELKSD